uniref:Uncharacterized protein n=1 Tax=Quercus lobata TaxID=97700 RepID=A0A7N2MZK3_QUELO
MDQPQNAYPFDGFSIIPEVLEILEFGEEVPPAFREAEIVVDQGWTFLEFLAQLLGNDYDEALWWKFDGGEVISFGLEGSKLFIGIVKILLSFHEESKFSGNLLRNIRILGDLSVTHIPSAEEENAGEAFGGRENDIIHFRWMVAAVVRTCFPENYRTILSSSFRLFFSKIFIHPEGIKNYFVCQLYHPIFFNSSDRCKLIRMIKDLYNQNPKIFRDRFTLSRYGFCQWWLRIDRDHDDHDVYQRNVWKRVLYHRGNSRKLYSFGNNCYALPLYIRNVHEHFPGGILHEDVDSGLDIIFPGVSAAIIDAVIRDLHGYWDCFGCSFAYLQRTPPYGLSFPPYRFGNGCKCGSSGKGGVAEATFRSHHT